MLMHFKKHYIHIDDNFNVTRHISMDSSISMCSLGLSHYYTLPTTNYARTRLCSGRGRIEELYGADLPSFEPAGDAMEVEGMVADAPRYRAILGAVRPLTQR